MCEFYQLSLSLSSGIVRVNFTCGIDKQEKSAECVSAAVLSLHTHVPLLLTPPHRLHYWRPPPSCAHAQWRFCIDNYNCSCFGVCCFQKSIFQPLVSFGSCILIQKKVGLLSSLTG